MTTELSPWHEGQTGWPLSLFVDERTRRRRVLQCGRNHCRQVIKEPWQLECGHRFCKECLDKIRDWKDAICVLCAQDLMYDDVTAIDNTPIDIDLIDEETKRMTRIDADKAFPDHPAQKEISRLIVRCPWGCESAEKNFSLKVKELAAHMKKCTYRLVKCNKCGEKFQHRYTDHHMQSTCSHREVICPHGCGTSGLKSVDLNEHKAKCTKRPEVCRMCKEVIPHGSSLHQHYTSDCRGECPFGCEVQLQGGLLVAHLEDPEYRGRHLSSLVNCVSEIKEAQAADKTQDSSEIKSMEVQIKQLMDRVLSAEDRIEKFEREQMESSSLASLNGIIQTLDKAEGRKRQLAYIESQANILDQNVHLMVSQDTVFNTLKRKIVDQQEMTSEKVKKLENDGKMKDSIVKEQERKLRYFSSASFNGRLLWRVDNVAVLRDSSQKGERYSIYSDPFYTDTYGYKMCMRLYLNGDGNGKSTHISLFFVVMKGEYDALLPWPFEHKVTMTLKNQTKVKPDITERFRPERTSSSFERPKNEKNIASGCPQFATQAEVFHDINGYVVDDTMFFEVVVDPHIDPPPPRTAVRNDESQRHTKHV